MRCAKGLWAALVVAGLSFSAATMAGSTAPDSSWASNSVQTYTFTPGSTGYASWAAWVTQQSATLQASLNPYGASSIKGVGTITVQVKTPLAGSSSNGVNHAMPMTGPAPTGNPPVSLPATGTPGQVITINNQVGGTTQSWTYEWTVSAGSGGGGWVLTGFSSLGCGESSKDPSGIQCLPKGG